MVTPESISDKIRRLPQELQQEVDTYVDRLLERESERPEKPLKLDWRGALADLYGEADSVDIQHKTLDLWTEE